MTTKYKHRLPFVAADLDRCLRLIHRHVSIGADIFADLGISQVQLEMLRSLAEKSPKTSTELTRERAVDKSTISQSLSVLSARGYIKLEENPDDRRSKWIHLTSSALEALQRIDDLRAAKINAVLEAATEAEKNAIGFGMGLLSHLIESGPRPHAMKRQGASPEEGFGKGFWRAIEDLEAISGDLETIAKDPEHEQEL